MTTTSSGVSALSDYISSQQTAVTSAKSAAASSNSTNANMQEIAGNFTTFISILTTQLKNQDPTAASDTNQFTQELVMFAQAEQQLATNSKLDTLISSTNASLGSNLVNYTGKYIETSTTTKQIVVQDGTAAFSYKLDDTPAAVAITVKDSSGNTVVTMTGPTSSGSHLVQWDGKNSSGTAVDDGTYTISVKEVAASGTTSTVSDVYLVGRVTGVTLDGTSSTLSIGDVTVKLSDVSQVFETDVTSSSTTSTSS